MGDLTKFCAPGTIITEEMVPVASDVALRVITFTPAQPTQNPPVLFVAGWVSLIEGWQRVLVEMTRDFVVYYIETREKISSRTNGTAGFGVEDIGQDLPALVKYFQLEPENYVLFGSSLGATVILDAISHLNPPPLCQVLIGPNAVFRVPALGMLVVHLFYPGWYLAFRPLVKWYLRNFRLDVRSDYAQYQKYCNALDAADPWKLKKGIKKLAKYEVWPLLPQIQIPTLVVGASKDLLHEPANLKKMVQLMPRATYLDLETNEKTHNPEVVQEMRKYIQLIQEKHVEIR